MKEVKIELKNVYKIFGNSPKKALSLLKKGMQKEEIFRHTAQSVGVCDATFQIYKGEIFVIMGLSGSGKSTLVRLINRLIEPSGGAILIDGEDITTMKSSSLREVRRKKMSMVFQSFALLPHLSVLDNVAFGLELGGISKTERHEKAKEALLQVGLLDYVNVYPDALSGGMQQRVGLARALANNPDILLMDEAFSALDPLIRSEMQDELLKLQSEQERTIVFISHDLDEAMKLGDRIAIMQGGEVVQIGSSDEILKNPANDYVRSFFKGVNVGGIISAKDIASTQQVTIIQKDGQGTLMALQILREHDRNFGYIVDRKKRFLGIVSVDSLREKPKRDSIDVAFLKETPVIEADACLNDIVGIVANTPYSVPVVDENQKYLGAISKASLLKALDYQWEDEHE
ncbi:glycine betaine/L-proline ABC transporter ATP-binding protein ProV [Sulfurospirillum barnesii]|uniref:Glycine betaine/L-proline transport ATP binding subunit n=1 Tax=Sulfurospirillum barnesii (strain ATCC 700032 / DSM 10660 / SES-3) TaxID=760154 RepID=I3XTS1_SULBS|nr:glycine betaine/L-proline ABC transporter ATP-binding protein ProV [Sulfurospirillum barnesii]AFL67345.1 glycine betaine/L-proline transport ATP binding subunit [Sulfurospirillum barnesii SES-3]